MVEKFDIYRNGVVVAHADSLEYHGQRMGERYVLLSFSGAVPTDLAVGDYIDYRGERFVLTYVPSVVKKARSGSVGDAFTYKDVKMSSLAYELLLCDFRDYVLYGDSGQQQNRFTSQQAFSVYCADVRDWAARLQANLDRAFGASGSQHWTVHVKEEQGEVGGKKDIVVDVQNLKVWGALGMVSEKFDMTFYCAGRHIYIGYGEGYFGGLSTALRYGKGNGLYEVERVSQQDQGIFTRFSIYGSTENLPTRYYQHKATRCYAYAAYVDGTTVHMLLPYRKSMFTRTVLDVPYVQIESDDGSYTEDVAISAVEEDADQSMFTLHYSAGVYSPEAGDKIYFTSGVDIDKWTGQTENVEGSGLPAYAAILNLMLPGFPLQSLDDVTRVVNIGGTNTLQLYVGGSWEDVMDLPDGWIPTFSDDALLPWIESPAAQTLGIREDTVYFDGSDDDHEDIRPTLDGMTGTDEYGQEVDADMLLAVDSTGFDDDGIERDGMSKTFWVRLPSFGLGYNLKDEFDRSGSMSVDVQSGLCGGRSFNVAAIAKETTNGNVTWKVTLEREADSTLQLYFPNQSIYLEEGDRYVLTSIEMPDVYVTQAAKRLLRAGVEWAIANDHSRSTYQPKVDEIMIAMERDSHADVEDSVYWNMREGQLLAFADTDLGLNIELPVEQLTIKEYGNGQLPTFEVTLQEDEEPSRMQQLEAKVAKMSYLAGNPAGTAADSAFFSRVPMSDGSVAVKLKTRYTGLFTDGFLAALGAGSEQGGGGGGGSVTSIGMTVPQGFTVSPSSISQSGTFAVGFASGYSLPSNNLQDSWTAKQDAISDLATIRQNAANGNTAYESLNGYALKSYLEGNWLVKSLSSIRQSPATVLDNRDEVVCGVSLNSGVLQVSYGNLSIPTKTSDLTNDSGFITSSALSGYLPRTGGLVGGSLILYPSEAGFVDSWRMTELDCANELTQEDYPYLPYDDRYLAYFNTNDVYPLYVGGGMVLQDLYTGDYGDITVNTLHVMNSARVANLNADLLDGYHASSFARASALNNYLPLTGGTLTGNLTIGNTTIHVGTDGGRDSISIGNDAKLGDSNQSGMIAVTATTVADNTYKVGFDLWHYDGTPAGRIYSHINNGLMFDRYNGTTYDPYKIWHEGNDGSGSGLDADTLDGNHASWFVNEVGQNDFDVKRPGYIITADNDYDTTTAHPFDIIGGNQATILQCVPGTDGSYGSQLAIGFGHPRLAWRNRNGSTTWSVWQQIIAGSADTLTTARSLWGQPFDGSGDVDGNLTFSSGYGINNLHTIYCAYTDLNHTLYLGYGGKDRVTWHEYGNDWQFWYGQGTGERTGGKLSVRLGATNYFEGNVGIGTPSPSYNLDVAGTLRATGNILTNGYVQIGNARLVWDSTNNAIRVEGVSGTANLYATGGLASLGIGSGSSGSVTNLTVTNKLRIKAGSSGYHSIENELINGNNYLRLSGDSGIDLDSDTVIGGTLSVDGVGGLHVEDGVEAYGDITAGGDLTVGGDVKVDYNGDTYRLNVQAAINAGILTQVTA